MQTNSSPSLQSPGRPDYCPEERRIRRRRPFSTRFGRTAAFSLTEVVIALGVIAFAFVALLGMLPVGLNAFNNSIDSTMETQIAENVMSQLRQAQFSQLGTEFNNTQATPDVPSFFKAYNQNIPPPLPGYYYDDQGNAALSGTTPVINPVMQAPIPTSYVYAAGVQVFYETWNVASGAATAAPFNVQPENTAVASGSYNPATPQPGATVIITISKISSPNVARVYTGYIGNNGF